MNFTRKLFSIIVFAVGLCAALILVWLLADRDIDSTSKIYQSIFFIAIGLLAIIFGKWLWPNIIQINEIQPLSSNYIHSPDSVIVKVPTGVHYKLELSSPDPTIAQSEQMFESQYEFKPLTRFPKNLFYSESYNGWKFLVAMVLLLSSIYFLTGFPGFLSIQNSVSIEKTSGLIPFAWNFFFGNGSSSKISSTFDLSIRFFIFIFTYCLAWISFDPKEAEAYAMGCFNILIGLLYIFIQVDTIPDFVPVVGMLDDTFLGAGMILLGASGCYKAKIREATTDTAIQLISDGNSNSAIQLLLKDKGITIQDK